jgi:hypothetical protein
VVEHILDAKEDTKMLARYINDAKWMNNVGGLQNNCRFETVGLKVYVTTIRDIPKDSELFIGYGTDYWKAIKHNQML